MDKTGDSEVSDCNANVTKLNIVKVLKMKSKEKGEVTASQGHAGIARQRLHF